MSYSGVPKYHQQDSLHLNTANIPQRHGNWRLRPVSIGLTNILVVLFKSARLLFAKSVPFVGDLVGDMPCHRPQHLETVGQLQDGIVSMIPFDVDNSRGVVGFVGFVDSCRYRIWMDARAGWCTIDRVFTPARYSGLLQISSSQYPRWTCVSLHTSHQLHNLSPWVVEPVLDPPQMPESPLARRPIGLGETPERVTHGCQQSVLHRVGILEPTKKH